MINGQFGLSIKDVEKFHELKRSTVYSEYMQSVANSPIMAEIINEHIEELDVKEDIDKLKGMNASSSDFSTVFIDTLKKMANRIVADTVILKELSDISIQDVKDDLTQSFKIKYLLGLADSKYYDKAEKVLTDKPDNNSVLYHGLIEYHKKHKGITTGKNNIKQIAPKKKVKKIKPTVIKAENKDNFTVGPLDI